jgi:pimeloyl-ACP methyl ester carboxylesterase
MDDAQVIYVRSMDGTQLAVWRSGSGPPLVAVHGTTADHTRWASVAARLGERFTLHAMDRRGRGRSGDVAPYSIQREAEDVAAVVRSAGERVVLLGHSYGGLCCLEAALQLSGLRLDLGWRSFTAAGSRPDAYTGEVHPGTVRGGGALLGVAYGVELSPGSSTVTPRLRLETSYPDFGGGDGYSRLHRESDLGFRASVGVELRQSVTRR